MSVVTQSSLLYSIIVMCAGCLDLIYTEGPAGKVEGLQMMSRVETGSHMDMSLVHCRKVAALVLEPITTGLPCHQAFHLHSVLQQRHDHGTS